MSGLERFAINWKMRASAELADEPQRLVNMDRYLPVCLSLMGGRDFVGTLVCPRGVGGDAKRT